jgi:hypothetical protein
LEATLKLNEKGGYLLAAERGSVFDPSPFGAARHLVLHTISSESLLEHLVRSRVAYISSDFYPSHTTRGSRSFVPKNLIREASFSFETKSAL